MDMEKQWGRGGTRGKPNPLWEPAVVLKIVDLPEDLDQYTTHTFGPDSFKLHRLPLPAPGKVLGLVGPHSVGKTTALRVLAKELKPNLGRFNDSPDWSEIRTHFDRLHLERYFTELVDKNLKVVFKQQQVPPDFLKDQRCSLEQLLRGFNERDRLEDICEDLGLSKYLHLRVNRLRTRVHERVSVAIGLLQKADVYIFDEISNSFDTGQRFRVAQHIRALISPDRYVIVVDNDLSVIDYVSDYMYCVYGQPGEYGIFAHQGWNVKAGIEHYLCGFDPVEKNLIRGEPLIFEAAKTADDDYPDKYPSRFARHSYPSMSVSGAGFKLQVKAGSFDDGQILLVMGDKDSGKTIFMRMLAGVLPPDDDDKGVQPWRPRYLPSYKPQKNVFPSKWTVRELLHRERPIARLHWQFVSDVMKPLEIEPLLDRKMGTLSPGETQRVAITLGLATAATVYLIDEPSKHLDSDMRIKAAMAIRRHVHRVGLAAVIVEHDFLMAAYLADKVVLVEREPSPSEFGTTSCVYPRVTGLNLFLKKLDITFRRNPATYRFTPRVNKLGSVEDKDQKTAGVYYGLA